MRFPVMDLMPLFPGGPGSESERGTVQVQVAPSQGSSPVTAPHQIPMDQGARRPAAHSPVRAQSGASLRTTLSSRPGSSPRPGTTFSTVQQLWRKRTGQSPARRRSSPSRASRQATTMMATTIRTVESKMQELAQASASALEDMRVASAQALEQVQGELGTLRASQSQQASQVDDLGRSLQHTQCRIHGRFVP